MNIASQKASHTGRWDRKRIITVSVVGVLIIAIAADVAACSILSGEEAAEAEITTDTVSVDAVTEAAESVSGIVYDESAVEGGWDSLSEEEIIATLNEKVDEGMINISMNTSPVFADGESEGNLMIVNETINNYPQIVEIYLDETGECIYTSGAIPVGSKIETAALDVALEAGVYSCTALFHNVDPDTGSIIGTAGAVITITVQS